MNFIDLKISIFYGLDLFQNFKSILSLWLWSLDKRQDDNSMLINIAMLTMHAYSFSFLRFDLVILLHLQWCASVRNLVITEFINPSENS